MSRKSFQPLCTLSIADANKRVDELVQTFYTYLKSDCHLNVSEVVKGGSLGHGTAIPGDFDLDLVLYSRDIDPDTVVDIGVSNIVERLDTFLRRRLGQNYKFVNKTAFSLQFKFHGDIDVDLLPSPYWDTPDELHRYLEDISKKDCPKFSCSAAKWQVKYFKDQPNEVKEYIKRFKAWRNSKWPKGQDGLGRPKSYLLGLLMIEAYKKSQDKRLSSVQGELVQMIKNHEDLSIKWNDGYYEWTYRLTNSEIQSLIKNGRFTLISSNRDGTDIVYDNEQKRRRQYTPITEPEILDPANPFNNIYKSGIGNYFGNDPEGSYRPGVGNWTRFAELIDTFNLTQPIN